MDKKETPEESVDVDFVEMEWGEVLRKLAKK